ncbi:MAG: hypothetical protein Q605_AUC00836G0001, partial [Actinomyces urogenitalis DORA_12]
MARLLGAGVSAGPFLLLGHEVAEGELVDLDALLGSHLQGQVDGEAGGVVQLEGHRAGNHRLGPGVLGLLLGGGHGRVQDRRAGGQGTAEGVLLGVGDLGDLRPAGLQLGVGQLHDVLGGCQQGGHRCVLHAEQTHGAHRAADEATQHVAAAVVARAHAVANEHEGAADVVGDHAHAHVVLVGLPRARAGRSQAVLLAAHRLSSRDDGVDLVDLVHVGLVLHDEGQPLQARTGVNGGLVELADELKVVALALPAQELIEDEVPDLQEAVTLSIGHRAAVRTVLGAAVVVDLAAGTGGAGLA